MLLCRVEGSAVSMTSHPSLRGWRLLICQPLDADGGDSGQPILCLDNLGAGRGQQVIITSDGKSVREKVGDPRSPARYMVMAMVDRTESIEEVPA